MHVELIKYGKHLDYTARFIRNTFTIHFLNGQSFRGMDFH